MEGQMDKQEARRKSVFAEQRGQKVRSCLSTCVSSVAALMLDFCQAFSTAFCKQENFPAELLRGVTKKGKQAASVCLRDNTQALN